MIRFIGSSGLIALLCIGLTGPTLAQEAFSVFSPQLSDGGLMPDDLKCERDGGDGVTPPLGWRHVPEGTQNLAVIMHHYPRGASMRFLTTTALILCAGSALAETRAITADIWADNWFEMSINGTWVIEDSVPITTERSFNAETVTFDAEFPMTIAIMAKDFRENDTGLEYIGTPQQQMGDGGIIAQFHDADSGEILAVTNSDMRCLVVHHAPISRSCVDEQNPVAGQGPCGFEISETPADWTTPGFDSSAWPLAVEHSAQAVRPKDGYDEITWDDAAKLIWSSDLELDNTLLCRVTIDD